MQAEPIRNVLFFLEWGYCQIDFSKFITSRSYVSKISYGGDISLYRYARSTVRRA